MRRMRRIVWVVALVACAVVGVGTPAASAEVALDCPPGEDRRNGTDRLPRSGVVVATAGRRATTWSMFGIAPDGRVRPIAIPSHPAEHPLVAVWQGGTSCEGRSNSRNAWAAAPDGRVFASDHLAGPAAGHHGDMAGRPLNRPVVGMSATGTGLGYWLVASDGGIFAFGDAAYHGSTGGMALNRPVVGMSVAPSGAGYWLVAADGGVFSFGDAPFHGSTGSLPLQRPITAMLSTPSGAGYWMVAEDGGVFAFGDAPFRGSMGGQPLSAPIAGMAAGESGYVLIGQDGSLYPFA